ncbi:Uncharacterised protein [Mycobacteroides abscessus subsp. abscessus]|nr:Uncharacterised protein [Mycobacteroides abscessus subsp. abscessus]SKU03175.1 Uncharacterised protein [Mycobacteroides abscessus subsp. abscessus]
MPVRAEVEAGRALESRVLPRALREVVAALTAAAEILPHGPQVFGEPGEHGACLSDSVGELIGDGAELRDGGAHVLDRIHRPGE